MYTYNMKIIRVLDGDTFEAEVDLGFKIWAKDKFRIFGYSAPEIHGEEKRFGLIAKAKLEEYFKIGEIYIVNTIKPDKYGRWLASFPDRTFVLNLIKQGYGMPWDGQSPRPIFNFSTYPSF